MEAEKLIIQQASYSGPLDLLLELIREMKVEIEDISISKITDQYLDYMSQLEALDLEIAGDYLVMAATLMEMKSLALLPEKPIAEEEEDRPMTRDELISQLVEYKQYKEASHELEDRHEDRAKLYSKPITNLEDYQREIPLAENEMEVSDLFLAFNRVINRLKEDQPLITTIDREEVSVADQRDYLLEKVSNSQQPVLFADLFQGQAASRSRLVATFLAMLELVKRQELAFKQDSVFDDLIIYKL